jgi:hypothetical protein
MYSCWVSSSRAARQCWVLRIPTLSKTEAHRVHRAIAAVQAWLLPAVQAWLLPAVRVRQWIAEPTPCCAPSAATAFVSQAAAPARASPMLAETNVSRHARAALLEPLPVQAPIPASATAGEAAATRSCRVAHVRGAYRHQGRAAATAVQIQHADAQPLPIASAKRSVLAPSAIHVVSQEQMDSPVARLAIAAAQAIASARIRRP